MSVLHQIIVMIVTLGVLVAFHEYGHFWVARKSGVKVLRFSVGFGNALLKWKDKLNTEYVIAALPLGGYVKMLDEREGEVAEQEKHLAFNRQSPAIRIAIVSAGPLANFLLAILVYWFVFLRGSMGLAPVVFDVEPGSIADQAGFQKGYEILAVDGSDVATSRDVHLALLNRLGDTGEIRFTARYQGADLNKDFLFPVENWLGQEEGSVDPLSDLGIGFFQPELKAIVDQVVSGSPAEKAGLVSGDELLEADGQKIHDWYEWVEYVRSRPGQSISIKLSRDGLNKELEIIPDSIRDNGEDIGRVGVSVKPPVIPDELIKKKEYNVFTAWSPALGATYDAIKFSLLSVKKLILGDISYKQLSGPISIAKVATESAYSGIYSYLSLLALLSVSLGVLNLLPIPVLDGGHILFYGIEWLKGSPVPERAQILAYQVGLFLVLSVMVLAIFNDIGRL